ncbi:hypothetical protein Syun_022028 [Stephania yunnanensis]|uniref:Protein kinase domain-containing protein n=1 Tax=Stephania yunnanensis TaxID=152371 RepID=A0AAP0II59_9MAGN
MEVLEVKVEHKKNMGIIEKIKEIKAEIARTQKNKATVALAGIGIGMPKADKKWYAAPTDSSYYRSAKMMYEEASQVANDAVGSIRTVASSCAEENARTRTASTVKAIVDERISNGEIYRGKLKDGSLVAIKCLKLKKRHTTQNFSHQIELISKLRHRDLVDALGHCFECYLDDSSVSIIFIVFEYVPNGTLRDCISEEVVMVVETIDVVAEVVEKVAEGMEENTICLIFDHFSGFREMCGYRFVVLLIDCTTM